MSASLVKILPVLMPVLTRLLDKITNKDDPNQNIDLTKLTGRDIEDLKSTLPIAGEALLQDNSFVPASQFTTSGLRELIKNLDTNNSLRLDEIENKVDNLNKNVNRLLEMLEDKHLD